jgi:hypothetical protein
MVNELEGENLPAAQRAHVELIAPTASLYFPGSQLVQRLVPSEGA